MLGYFEEFFAGLRELGLNSLEIFSGLAPEAWTVVGDTYLSFAFNRTALTVGLGLVALIVTFRFLRRRRTAAAPNTDLASLTNGPRRIGYFACAILVFGFGTWSVLAPLEGAALAPGVISPEGNRKTVQHLEGGIVRAIHVREGDVVSAGELLLVLDDIEARAKMNEVGQRRAHLLARAARLEAEVRGSAELDRTMGQRANDLPEVREALAIQQMLLDQRIASQKGRQDILEKRIKQLEAEINGLERMNEGLDEKSLLIGEEIDAVAALVEKGLERRPRLLGLKRASTDIGIQRASNEAEISRNLQSIGETELQLLTMRQQDVENASEELTEIRRAIAELESEMPWRQDVLSRTEVRSPISGTVMNVGVTTQSGVVRGGEPLLDIVPNAVPLIIDARVKPTDIDIVRPGMTARIMLSAYQQRNMPQIFGTLQSISADRLVDDRTGAPFFLAKVAVSRSELEKFPKIELVPGMPADVMLLTGTTSLMDYLIGPLKGSFRNSFREDHRS